MGEIIEADTSDGSIVGCTVMRRGLKVETEHSTLSQVMSTVEDRRLFRAVTRLLSMQSSPHWDIRTRSIERLGHTATEATNELRSACGAR